MELMVITIGSVALDGIRLKSHLRIVELNDYICFNLQTCCYSMIIIIFVLINKHVVIQHFVTLVAVFNYFELKIATTCIFAQKWPDRRPPFSIHSNLVSITLVKMCVKNKQLLKSE